MKNIWKFIIGGILVAALVVLIVRTNKEEKRFFNQVELTNNNFVINRTEMTYLDTVIKIGLDELGYTGIGVVVRNLTLKNNNEDLTYVAHILRGTFFNLPSNHYLIEIEKGSKRSMITTISHELIHLDQFETNKLVVTRNYIVWKGDTLSENIPDYFDRKWEKNAFELEKKLSNKIKKRLYE